MPGARRLLSCLCALIASAITSCSEDAACLEEHSSSCRFQPSSVGSSKFLSAAGAIGSQKRRKLTKPSRACASSGLAARTRDQLLSSAALVSQSVGNTPFNSSREIAHPKVSSISAWARSQAHCGVTCIGVPPATPTSASAARMALISGEASANEVLVIAAKASTMDSKDTWRSLHLTKTSRSCSFPPPLSISCADIVAATHTSDAPALQRAAMAAASAACKVSATS
mmetsp:Transcript_378/g.844  ORF Transcript_378/g.844 Transcript_378/m.844 type:complete len:227 (+) Transcript_378:192-872(+)